MKLALIGDPRFRRRALLAGLLLAGLLFAPCAALAGQANIFIYHRFGEGRHPSTNIEVPLFADHMRYLKESGRLILPLSEIVKHLESGRELPDHTVVLTVDDAFESFLQNAMPVIRTHHFPVTLFVNTDSVGQSGYLDWDELRQLVREGVEIGNHSSTHDYLLERRQGESRSEWRERVRNDILEAQNAFARELGFRPDLFAYPYGEYSPELTQIVRDLGFRAAVAQQSGVVSGASDRYTLPRFPMGGPFASLQSFRSKVDMAPFEVEVLKPESPVLDGAAPPVLEVRVTDDGYDLGRIQGFVQGENTLDISVAGDGVVTVRAERPLAGRRNKYTLTVPLKDGSGWAWFSQPWFRPQSGF